MLFPEASAQTLQTLRVLAGNAVGFASLSLFLHNTTDRQVLRPGLAALALFHSAVLVAQLTNSLDAGSFNPALIPHLLFAGGFWMATLQPGLKPASSR